MFFNENSAAKIITLFYKTAFLQEIRAAYRLDARCFSSKKTRLYLFCFRFDSHEIALDLYRIRHDFSKTMLILKPINCNLEK